jgi:hypothetical protein
MSNHNFCRLMLSEARAEAREKNVNIPCNITALKSTKDLYFVESVTLPGEYIKGDCKLEARANYIRALIDRHEAADAL